MVLTTSAVQEGLMGDAFDPSLPQSLDDGERETFATGAVRDTSRGKGRPSLCSPFALRRLWLILEKGARHYGDRNWELGMPQTRFFDSAIRHLYSWLAGDRSEDHLAAAAFNVFAMIHQDELIRRNVLPDWLHDVPDYSPPRPEEAS